MVKSNKKQRRRQNRPTQVLRINNSPVKPSRRRKRVMNMPRSINSSGVRNFIAHYRNALTDPFSPLADGVRIPDSFRYPTIPYKYTTRLQLKSDINGELQFTVLPCPYLSLMLALGTVNTGVAYGFAANAGLYSLATPAVSNAAGYSQYRVAAWGVRLFATDTALNAKGQYIVAPVPVPANTLLDWKFLDSTLIGTGQMATDCLGLQRPNAGIETSPMSCEFNAQNLMYGGDFRFNGVPYSADCQRFRPVSESINSPYNTASDFYSGQAAGSLAMLVAGSPPQAIHKVGSLNQLDMSGNIALLVCASGLPPSTAEVTLEIRYHVEHIAAIPSNSIGIPVSDIPPVGNTAMVERVFTAVQNIMKMGQHPLSRIAMNQIGMAGMAWARNSNSNRQHRLLMG